MCYMYTYVNGSPQWAALCVRTSVFVRIVNISHHRIIRFPNLSQLTLPADPFSWPVPHIPHETRARGGWERESVYSLINTKIYQTIFYFILFYSFRFFSLSSFASVWFGFGPFRSLWYVLNSIRSVEPTDVANIFNSGSQWKLVSENRTMATTMTMMTTTTMARIARMMM